MSLKLCNGGSKVRFSQNNECCVPFCGATRQSNRTLPFYTFPTDAALRQEWLDVIKIDDGRLDDFDRQNNPLMVCSKHFKQQNGGMKLFIEDLHLTSSMFGEETTGVGNSSTGREIYVDRRLLSLQKKYPGIQMNYGLHVQCRTCARTSLKTMSIYDVWNLQMNLENLINKYLSIKVTPTDKKPLHICIDCVLKLKQFDDFFNICDNNNKLFDEADKYKKNLGLRNKNNNNEIIILSDSENEDTKIKKEYLEHLSPSKFTKVISNSNPQDFIKKESRKTKIKLRILSKANCAQNNEISTDSSSAEQANSMSRIIDIEFVANYIINHGVEWIHEINIDKDQVKMFSQETIDLILEAISSTLKKQCNTNNSKVVPLEMPQVHLDGTSTLLYQVPIRTKSVIMNGKVNDN